MKRVRFRRLPAAAILVLLLTFLMAFSALAADGWHRRGSRIWYTSESAETGQKVRAAGLTQINGHTYYFNKNGYLRTGWIRIHGKYHYFRTTGKIGVRGRMYTAGLRKVLRAGLYGFSEDGSVLSGLCQVGDSWYYFSTSRRAGVSGLMLKKTFADTADGRRIYLLKNGKMAVNRWVKYKKKYYFFGADGNMYRSTVTPDGWKVNARGIRTKRASAAEAAGAAGSTSASVSNLRKAGTKASTGKASILIICGHGQGDSGALGKWGGSWIQEQAYTRDFGSRIYRALSASGRVKVDMLDTSLDGYSQVKNTLNAVIVSGKTLQSRIEGKGTYGAQAYNALRSNGRLPDLLQYDYVLEVHFDASATSGKDYNGDGKMKGTFMYVNSRKSETYIDSSII
ncbi:MAG: N-acetylmuramoyl-L-alanine amidase, partial [Lachnospiraceae bacterium]|nr:N-acetylmuramoyl-L-alanine amidase [Lachnospiraceae bacterium]